MSSQTLRIIAGSHRGRKLLFPEAEGLRPTPDRVRETLFNWLQPVLAGANCLDMFAGSGVLGMEAASRGARRVVFIESQLVVANQLADNINTLGLGQTSLLKGDALDVLKSIEGEAFDIVFVDPPFHQDLVNKACRQLQQLNLLKPVARIYIESEKPISSDDLPAGWVLTHAKKAGQVFYHLAIAN